jgi:23S rRNA (guanosine2251-2'-O)-methyltransferase
MKKESYIFGIHPVLEAIKSGKEIEKLLFQKGLRGEGFREIFQLSKELEIPFQFVPIEKLNSLSRQNHQGVICYLSEISYTKIEDLVPFVFEQGRIPLILVLDGITDVRNLGAIARSAECAGVDALLIPAQGSAQINSEAIKTSAGALYKLPVCRTNNLKADLVYLKNSGISLVAASEKADTLYTASDFKSPLALIMGSEGFGVSPEYIKMSDNLVKIPVFGEIGSLNVSVAAGVLLYEVIRQRS